jgi:glycosyltransferase involved in cell wall biosynthesis
VKPEVLVHAASAGETVEHLRSLGVASRAVTDLAAAAAAADGDLVVMRGGARVGGGFVERLSAAVEAGEGTVATAAAIAFEGDPELIATRSLNLRPRTTRLTLDCTLVTRAALDLAGPLDENFGLRCNERGLVHVVADDVLVAGVPRTQGEDPLDGFEYGDLPPRPPTRLARALTWTRRVADGLEVTLDGRALRALQSGTEVQSMALIEALQRTGDVRVRVLLEDRAAPPLGDVETVTDAAGARRTAIVHRPQQVSSPDDLLRLAHFGERLVVTHLDLLLFHNPSYHATEDTFAGYRRMTGAALAAADLVVAISEHVERDLLAEDLVDPTHVRSVHLGTDHERPGPASAPAGLDALAGRPFIVQLGSDLRHKNRPFSIELLRELRALGWPGALVLAGPSVEFGSSRAAEDALLADPSLAAHVVRLAAVSDAERRWLYREAAAVAFPSTSEGFGLVPFEAAAAGTPPLVAHVSAMAELLPPELSLLVPWDARASAQRVLPALSDDREHIAGAVQALGQRLSWDRAAHALVELYDETLARPARAASMNAWQALAAEARRGHWEGSYWALRDEVGPTGLALVGKDGSLPEDAQRALAALAGRGATRGPLLRALRTAGKLGRAR